MGRPRRPLKFWGLAALTALFTLAGLLLLIVGPDADTRLTGLMSVLFFGVGGFAYLGGPLLTRSEPGTVQREHISTSAGLEFAFVFPTPGAKRIVMVVAAGGMTAACAVLIPFGALWIGIPGTAFFGAILVFMLLTLRHPQRLVLTPTRVLADAPAGTVELPWEAVGEVEVFEMSTGQATVDMLGVEALDSEAANWTRGRRLGRFNQRMTAYDLVTAADGFAGEAEDVAVAIRRYRDDPERRRHIGDEGELTQLRELLGERVAPA